MWLLLCPHLVWDPGWQLQDLGVSLACTPVLEKWAEGGCSVASAVQSVTGFFFPHACCSSSGNNIGDSLRFCGCLLGSCTNLGDDDGRIEKKPHAVGSGVHRSLSSLP